jgi:Fe-S-cluster containining protein
MMNSNQKNIETAFYSDGYKLGMTVAVSDFNQNSIFAAVSEMYAAIDSFNDTLSEFAKNQNQPIHCAKGCEWCCHQPVFALSFEMDYLIGFIEKNFDTQTKNRIKLKAESKMNAFGFLNETDLLNAKFPCPLLENGACLAYSARPMACRIYLSSEVKSCLRFFNEPGDKNSIPTLLNLPLRAGKMMNEGFKAALKTSGYETKEYRIEEKLV